MEFAGGFGRLARFAWAFIAGRPEARHPHRLGRSLMVATTQHSPADAMECLRALKVDRRGSCGRPPCTGVGSPRRPSTAVAELDRVVTEWLAS